MMTIGIVELIAFAACAIRSAVTGCAGCLVFSLLGMFLSGMMIFIS